MENTIHNSKWITRYSTAPLTRGTEDLKFLDIYKFGSSEIDFY